MKKSLLDIAIEASILAGKAIMEIYETDFNVEIKDDNSPLTQADKAANSVINRFLVETNIPIISEENEQIPYSERKNWESCWIVDPLDGTKEFVKRNGEFTVNIALITKGKPVMGVIYVPVTKTLYFSKMNNEGAYKIGLDTHKFAESIVDNATVIKKANRNEGIIKLVGSRSHMNDETTEYMETLRKEGGEVEIIAAGSSLKFCLVAEGKAHVYPRFAPTMEWDTAAGQSICEAAGSKVVVKETMEPLTYNRENLLNPHFLVS